jgi:hypothetical protein
MYLRRALFYWQFIAAIVLPSWVLIGRGIILDGVGWDLLLYLVLCPILFVVMLAVAGLTAARKSVRDARAVSWTDAAVIGAWHIAIIAYGFATSSVLSIVIVVIALVAFWNAVWQLFAETRQRVQAALSLDPIDVGTYRAQTPEPGPASGRVIIVNPDGTREELPDR